MEPFGPIRTEEEYRHALDRLCQVFHSPIGTPERVERAALSDIIECYEKEHHIPIQPDLATALEFEMDQRGMTERDLAPYFGSVEKALEVLAGRGDITMPEARALHRHLKIPAHILLQEPAAESTGGGGNRPAKVGNHQTLTGE